MRDFYAVEFLIVRRHDGEEQLLMSERGPAKHGAGKMAIPGGHLNQLEDRIESYPEAAVRELREEVGEAIATIAARAIAKETIIPAAQVEDVRPAADQFYHHIAYRVDVPKEADVDPSAADSNEHVNPAWYGRPAVAAMLAEDRIYKPHAHQIRSFVENHFILK